MEINSNVQENAQKNVKISLDKSPFDVSKFLERSSARSEVVPGQAISIRELLLRAERGQRLGIQIHEPDVVPVTIPEDTIGVDERLDDVPPLGMDITEFDEYARGVYADKQAFVAKRKKASEEAKQPAEEDTLKDKKEE